MTIFIFILSAAAGCLIGQFNPSIMLSRLVYHKDIREHGSGNPGFTNFFRLFGIRWAWLVFLLDASKTAIVELIFMFVFDKHLNNPALGIAFTGLFVTIGHCFPLSYKFRGGKGALSALTTIFLLDWRCGLIGIAVLAIVLLTIRYMSLASICSISVGTLLLPAWGTCSGFSWVCCILLTALMIWRHNSNIKRILAGSENRFSFTQQKDGQ